MKALQSVSKTVASALVALMLLPSIGISKIALLTIICGVAMVYVAYQSRSVKTTTLVLVDNEVESETSESRLAA